MRRQTELCRDLARCWDAVLMIPITAPTNKESFERQGARTGFRNWCQLEPNCFLGSCGKRLILWWPGTESVSGRPLIPRKLLLFGPTRSSRCARSALVWHKTGTNSDTADPALFPGK